MNTNFTNVAGLLRFIAFIGIILLLSPKNIPAQIGVKAPAPPRVVDLFEPQIFGLERIPLDSTLFRAKPALQVRSVKMDSTGQFISISETVDKTEFFLPAVIDLATYIRLRLEFDTRELWKKTIINNFKEKVEKAFGAIKLDIPFRIKSKTFTRIFGSDRIGLRVTGNISFDLSGRTEERSGSAISATENRSTFSPRFRQTQQFTVEGNIGEKVTVSVEQNSEATTDLENTLKLHYKGDEDEIVQRIEAGNISLSLPSTRYVIFGGSNKGLFGLKTLMQIGNLHFTAIASLEKGQQQEMTISGNSKESKVTIKDSDFIKNKYFFADMYYHNRFEDGLKDDPQTFMFEAGMDILQLDVFISAAYNDEDARFGVAILEPLTLDPQGNYKNINIDDLDLEEDIQQGKAFKGYFKRLLPDKEYTFDKYRGFLSLNQRVDNNRVLAVSYVVSDSRQWPKVGTLYEDLGDTSQAVILKLIKPRAMQPSNVDTWPLMMRNIYSLGGTNIQQDGFDIRLEYNATGTHDRYPEGGDKSFLNLLGLDILDENGEEIEGGDETVDNNPYIINRADGTLIFPGLEPFNPGPESRFKDKLPDKYRVDIYNLSNTNTSEFLNRNKFEMIIASKSTKSTFDMGFYVLEGSEVVTLGGKTLQRDKDYMIDYFSGQLTLLSNEAKRSSSNIQIKYERANLFQLDKKTIYGGRLEYKLSDNSFIGFTALYLNKSTLDRRVRVGQEPFQNFVWDVNAAFKFKPRFLTKMIDALPMIETNAESHFNIEGEFAQVIPDPNTLNNESTGDNNGVAYIDDFEASKRTTTLGIRYRTWSVASPPKVLPNLLPDNLEQNDDLGPYAIVDTTVNKSRATCIWFNPYHQTSIKDIWPNRDVNAQTGQTTDVLGVDIWREEGSNPDSAWAGIIRSTSSFPDQQKTKYIELWIKGTKGTINIDIGRISEDWYLNGVNLRNELSRGSLNTEDKNNNGLLDQDEDTGIDGISDGKPGDDPNDNWNEPKHGALDVYDGIKYDGINGTEGNSKSREARYPDSEDLDGDGQLTTTTEYFEYSFSLEDIANKWEESSTEKGWRLFRIPLKEYTRKFGNPDPNFEQIFYIRLWFSDLPTERTRIKIATFDFVGNEWEETGIAEHDSAAFVKNDSVFTLATYNTEENAEATGDLEPYKSPPGVTGVVDRITRARSKEQSLVMRFTELEPGYIAEAKKMLFSTMDVLNYKRMRMFLHGDTRKLPDKPPDTVSEADSSKIRFYLRFGSDANNYYEYGQDIYADWNSVNKMDIDLDELSQIKFIDSLNVGTADEPVFRKTLKNVPGGYYKAVNRPSLKTIRYFIIGVKNRDNEAFTGEIWLDELRLSDVRKENATALRLNADLKLADLLSINAQWESKDADFHNISTQFGKGNTNERQSYSGKLTLDKLLPDSWELSIPVDARASFSRSIPKYKPKEDALTGYSNNTIEKKLKSLFGIRDLPKELENLVTSSEVIGCGTTIKKRSKSKHWYIRYTIDEMLFDFDYSRKNSSNWEMKYNKSEQYKEAFRYNIPFGKDNYIMPLKFVSKIPVIKKLSDQKLYYTPSKIGMSLNISDTDSRKLRRNTGGVQNVENRVSNTSSTRSVNANYKMLNSLNFTYSRSYKSDADAIGLNHTDLLKEIITKGNFGLDTDVNQSFSGDFKPDIVKWFKINFKYTNNFKYQLTNAYKYKHSSNKAQKRFDFNLNPGQLLKSIYSPKKDKRTAARRGRRSQKSIKTEDNKKETQQQQEEKKKSSFPNPLMWIYNFLGEWQSIKATYSMDDKVSNKYVTGMPNWDYQFGFTQNPGVPQDTSLEVNLIGPVFQSSRSLRTSTSLRFSKNIKASLKHDITETESSSEYGKRRSGSRSRTYFATGDDPLETFENFSSGWRGFIPDWSVQISNIEKFLFFSSFAKSITIDHAHASKYSEQRSLKVDGSYIPTSQNFTNNWQPLAGMNISTKWGVSGNIRMTNNTSYSFSSGAGATKTASSSFTFSMSYSKTTGFRIPIPIWPFKGRTFKNEINFNMTYDSSENRTFQKQFGQDNFEEKMKNKSWKLRPSATYRFSSRVTGSLFYEMGTTENKISGKYSYDEFGITVNIAIRD